MIITERLRASRSFNITWQTNLLILISCILSYLAERFFFVRFFELPPLIPSVIGTALAFFIGFKNNQAYDRWWEARKIWGSLVNNSRTWARGVLAYTDNDGGDPEELMQVRDLLIRRHIGFLYALKGALRGQNKEDYKAYLPYDDIARIESQSNKHNAILVLQSQTLDWMLRHGWIDQFKFLQLDNMLVAFCDDMGKSERIKNTVFPTTYYSFTRLFIWLFGILVTMVAAETTGAWSILLGFLISLVFQITYIIGSSLVNPFEPDIYGIPLDQITRNIEINLLEMEGEIQIPEPIAPVNGEYVM